MEYLKTINLSFMEMEDNEFKFSFDIRIPIANIAYIKSRKIGEMFNNKGWFNPIIKYHIALISRQDFIFYTYDLETHNIAFHTLEAIKEYLKKKGYTIQKGDNNG